MLCEKCFAPMARWNSLMDEIEADQQDSLRAQKDRAEADIAAGRLVPWNEMKRVSGL